MIMKNLTMIFITGLLSSYLIWCMHRMYIMNTNIIWILIVGVFQLVLIYCVVGICYDDYKETKRIKQQYNKDIK